MQRDNSVTVAVATFCTGIFTETFLGLSSTASVEFRVQEFTTATVTQHSRNTQCSNGTEICCNTRTQACSRGGWNPSRERSRAVDCLWELYGNVFSVYKVASVNVSISPESTR